MHFRGALLCTEDQADRRIFARFNPVLASVIQIEVHLASVRVAETTHLQVDDHKASQPPVEKHQIDPKPRVVNPQTSLPADEGKIVAELKQGSPQNSEKIVR